jgi:uncharacterized membrane protein YGL010W
MSPTLQRHFTDYASFHRTQGNQAMHSVGIPLIVLSIFGMLAAVHLGMVGGYDLTLAEVALVLVTAYYLTLDVTLALLMLVISVVFVAVAHRLPLAVSVAIFLLGWVLQFIGHYTYEKKSPAFYRNGVHLLVGPLWILAKAVGRA